MTHFASKVRAMIAAAIGAAELVPPNDVVHNPNVPVVLWSMKIFKFPHTYVHMEAFNYGHTTAEVSLVLVT